ncbi:MAG: 7TMR-DISM family protein, partial [Spirochaetota bacterium]
MKIKRIWQVWAIILCAAFCASSLNAEELTLQGDEDHISLGKSISVFEDTGGKLTIDDIRKKEFQSKFSPCHADIPYYDFSPSVYWIRFTLRSASPAETRWFLEMGYPLMDDITFYSPDENGSIKAVVGGYSRPFSERRYQHRHFLYDISLPDNKARTFYFRFSCTDRMEIPLVLYSVKGFQHYDHNSQYILGIFFGFIVFMVIYNLLLFFSIRDRTYLIYCFFLLSYAAFQMTQNGTAYEYFWPEALSSINHFIPLTISLMNL